MEISRSGVRNFWKQLINLQHEFYVDTVRKSYLCILYTAPKIVGILVPCQNCKTCSWAERENTYVIKVYSYTRNKMDTTLRTVQRFHPMRVQFYLGVRIRFAYKSEQSTLEITNERKFYMLFNCYRIVQSNMLCCGKSFMKPNSHRWLNSCNEILSLQIIVKPQTLNTQWKRWVRLYDPIEVHLPYW